MARSPLDVPEEAVPLARITTRRMSHEELQAAKAEEAAKAGPPMPKASDLKVAARMRETRRLSEERFQKAVAFAAQRGVTEAEAVVLLSFASEDDVIATEAELTATRWMSSEQIAARTVPEDVAGLVPKETCVELKLCPLGRDTSGVLVLAMRDPADVAAVERVKGLTMSARLQTVRVGSTALEALVQRLHTHIDEDDPSTWIER